jgi:hypothetical protein
MGKRYLTQREAQKYRCAAQLESRIPRLTPAKPTAANLPIIFNHLTTGVILNNFSKPLSANFGSIDHWQCNRVDYQRLAAISCVEQTTLRRKVV